jgi:glutaredoxin
MSFCPYGVQAENVLIPVADLLGNRTDIRVRYIATVEGDSIATAQSLHGNAEAVEDARQLCIMKYAPERYWHYVSAFNAQCYPVWNNAGQLAACRKNVTVAAGISEAVIDNCANGSEGTGLLKEDAKRVEATGTSASPTLLINGQEYSGARTPDAFKQAICSHFDVPPVACNTTLSSQAAAASGGCG